MLGFDSAQSLSVVGTLLLLYFSFSSSRSGIMNVKHLRKDAVHLPPFRAALLSGKKPYYVYFLDTKLSYIVTTLSDTRSAHCTGLCPFGNHHSLQSRGVRHLGHSAVRLVALSSSSCRRAIAKYILSTKSRCETLSCYLPLFQCAQNDAEDVRSQEFKSYL